MSKKLTAIILSLMVFFVSAPVGVYAEIGDANGEESLIKVEAKKINETSVKLVWNWDLGKLPENFEPADDVTFSIFDGEKDLTEGQLVSEAVAKEKAEENGDDIKFYSYSEDEGYSFVVEDLEDGEDYELEVRSSESVENKVVSGKIEFSTKEAPTEVEKTEEAVVENEPVKKAPVLRAGSSGDGDAAEPENKEDNDEGPAISLKAGAGEESDTSSEDNNEGPAISLKADKVTDKSIELKWTITNYEGEEPESFKLSIDDGVSTVSEELKNVGDLENGFSHLVDNLSPAHKYTFIIEVVDSDKNITSDTQIIQTKDIISNFKATAKGKSDHSRNYLLLSWKAVEGADYYVITWSGDNYKAPLTTKNNTFWKTIWVADYGKTYTFKIKAVDANENDLSIVATCTGIVPKATIKTTSVAANSAKMTITIPKGHAGTYKIIKLLNGRETVLKTIENTGAAQTVTYEATGLGSAKSYKFYVVNADNNVVSNKSSIKTLVGNFKATAKGASDHSKNYIKLSWTAVKHADHYVITWSGDNYKTQLTTKNNTFWKTIWVANYGKTYTFKIKAVDAKGNALSYTATCKGIVPKTTIKVTSVTSNSAKMTVTIPKGHAGTYKIIKLINGKEKVLKYIKNTGAAQTVTYEATGLGSIKQYKFYVVNAGNNVVSNKSNIKTPLANVSGFEALSSSDAVILKWKKVPHATGYTITWEGYGKSGEIKISSGDTTTYIDKYANSEVYPYARPYKYSIKATKKECGSSKTAATVTGDAVRTMLLSITFGESRTLTSHSGGSVTASFPSGYTTTAVGFDAGKYHFYYNGRLYYVIRESISSASVAQLNTSRYYSAEEATSFVNRRGLYSSTNYLIWVNTYSQKEYIFYGSQGNWKLVQGPWWVATGKPSTPTSTGMTTIKTKSAESGVPYWNITSWFSLHGNHPSWGDLGYPKSGACVRNTNEHAKYIFYNCPIGTAVYVF